MEIAVLALGCFWGPEIKFSKIEGIIKTEVGYCGGNNSITTYKEVCTGNTGHAEVVKLDFDEKIITYEKILKTFFQIHDPTTLNSQGPDFGTQYRSEIFYLNDNQKTMLRNRRRREPRWKRTWCAPQSRCQCPIGLCRCCSQQSRTSMVMWRRSQV